MKKMISLTALTLLISSFSSHANEAQIRMGVELGTSKIAVDKDFAILKEDFDTDGLSINYVLGYKFANNVVTEANVAYSSSDILFGTFDSYETYEIKAMAGYSFDLATYFKVVPMVGFSHWELETKQGLFLNPGPEAEEEFSGTDFTYKVRFEVPVSDLVLLSLSYANTEAEFGRNETTQIGILFEF
ncbi:MULTISPECIES: outer membrane beta-barrel protein [Pseudoalteromonas]|jgi:hypothetical protein|nr:MULTISPECIES: outer membrane beta-barrel protein [Pseudoalteromonas]